MDRFLHWIYFFSSVLGNFPLPTEHNWFQKQPFENQNYNLNKSSNIVNIWKKREGNLEILNGKTLKILWNWFHEKKYMIFSVKPISRKFSNIHEIVFKKFYQPIHHQTTSKILPFGHCCNWIQKDPEHFGYYRLQLQNFGLFWHRPELLIHHLMA